MPRKSTPNPKPLLDKDSEIMCQLFSLSAINEELTFQNHFLLYKLAELTVQNQMFENRVKLLEVENMGMKEEFIRARAEECPSLKCALAYSFFEESKRLLQAQEELQSKSELAFESTEMVDMDMPTPGMEEEWNDFINSLN